MMSDELPIGTLLRLAADDELTEQQARVLEAHLEAHPEDRARIEFEHQLRGACRKTMEMQVPAGLRDRVAGQLEADRLEEVGEITRRPGFWTGPRRLSIAASILLLLVVGTIFRSAFLGPIDQELRLVQAAGFAAREHGHSERSPGTRHTEVASIEELNAKCEDWFGCRPQFASLEGLTLVGGGICQFSTGQRSVHLEFMDIKQPDAPVVSLFIHPRDAMTDHLAPGLTYELGHDEACAPIRVWVADTLVYYAVAETSDACEQMCGCAGAPEAAGELP